MRVRIETVYTNVDQKWIDWYLSRLKKEEVVPGSTRIVDELKLTGRAVFISKDPTGPCIATTTYEIESAKADDLTKQPEPKEGV